MIQNEKKWVQVCLVATALLFIFRLLSLGLYPLMEPSEARYAAISTEMAFGPDGFMPWIWADGCLVPFLGKPPLFFWIQSLCIQGFGVNEFATRLPCWLFALLSVAVLYEMLRPKLGNLVCSFACLMTVSCGVFFFMAGSIAVDMALVFGLVLAYCAYFNWLKSETSASAYGYSVLVFLGVALAFLSKGLLAVILIGFPVFVWHVIFGEWKKVLCRHAWVSGVVILVVLCGGWLYAMNLHTQNLNPPTNFFHHFFVEEHFNRFTSLAYSDPYGSGRVEPRGMAILFMVLATLPWGLIPIARIFQRRFKFSLPTSRENTFLWMNRDHAFFFLIAFCGTFFFIFARQILITYLLPLIPAFAIWLAYVWIAKRQTFLLKYFVALALFSSLGFLVFASITGAYAPRAIEKMATRDMIADVVKTDPSARFFVASRGRYYSPYFYAYDRICSIDVAMPCTLYDNCHNPVQLPCRKMMPMRLRPSPLDAWAQIAQTYSQLGPHDYLIFFDDDFADYAQKTYMTPFDLVSTKRYFPNGGAISDSIYAPCGSDSPMFVIIKQSGPFVIIRPWGNGLDSSHCPYMF